jgi:hypothetical protein
VLHSPFFFQATPEEHLDLKGRVGEAYRERRSLIVGIWSTYARSTNPSVQGDNVRKCGPTSRTRPPANQEPELRVILRRVASIFWRLVPSHLQLIDKGDNARYYSTFTSSKVCLTRGVRKKLGYYSSGETRHLILAPFGKSKVEPPRRPARRTMPSLVTSVRGRRQSRSPT